MHLNKQKEKKQTLENEKQCVKEELANEFMRNELAVQWQRGAIIRALHAKGGAINRCQRRRQEKVDFIKMQKNMAKRKQNNVTVQIFLEIDS